jgi:transposase-like protein
MWTEDKLNLLRGIFRQGGSIKGAARVMGLKPGTVKSAVRDNGLSVRWLQHEGRQQRSAKPRLSKRQRDMPIAQRPSDISQLHH